MLGFLIMLNVILVVLCIVFMIKLKNINFIKSKNTSKNVLVRLCIILPIIISIGSLYTGFRISGQKIVLEYDLDNSIKSESTDSSKNTIDYSNRVSIKNLIMDSLKDIHKAQNKLSIYTILSYSLYLTAYFLEKNVENKEKKGILDNK